MSWNLKANRYGLSIGYRKSYLPLWGVASLKKLGNTGLRCVLLLHFNAKYKTESAVAHLCAYAMCYLHIANAN